MFGTVLAFPQVCTMCAASYAIFLKNMFSCAVVVVSAVLSVFSGSSSLRQSGENGTIKQLTLYVSLEV